MKRTQGNQSVEKMLKIVEIMAASSDPMRLLDIANAVEQPSSTALRMLNTLIAMGYAYQEEKGMRRYGLTMKFLSIGQQATEHLSYRDIIHPYLVHLSQTIGETCCVADRRGNKIVYFDVVVSDTRSALTIRQQIGGSAFMHCTGSGKVFLMQDPEEKLDQLIRDVGLPSFTPHTITTREALLEELAICRQRGFAMDNEEIELGMRCLAAPVYDIHHHVIATISTSGPVSRMSRERCIGEIGPLFCRTAEEITDLITGREKENQQRG